MSVDIQSSFELECPSRVWTSLMVAPASNGRDACGNVVNRYCSSLLVLIPTARNFFACANFHDYADEMTTHFESVTYRFILKAIELDNYPKHAYVRIRHEHR